MLTQSYLKSRFHYTRSNGKFTKKGYVTKKGTVVKARISGSNNDTYRKILVSGTYYYAHRLAWLYVHGYMPENEIDHIDGDRHNNKLSNLREAATRCNAQNRCISPLNTSGFPGVTLSKETKKYKAQAKINYKGISLGAYDTALDAALARLTWELQCQKWTCNHRGELVKAIKATGLKLNL